eukprot:COSAG01_NODE_4935_length_4610_cov_45.500111_4_plen_297_part_00
MGDDVLGDMLGGEQVDPALHRDWEGPSPHGVRRLHGVRAKFEDFMEQRELIQEIISAAAVSAPAPAAAPPSMHNAGGGVGGGVGGVDGGGVGGGVLLHLVLLCVHAHHRFAGASARMAAVRGAFGNPPTTVVALPCCPTFNPTKDIGRCADSGYDDRCVFSQCRRVLVWRWQLGPDIRLKWQPQLGTATVSVAGGDEGPEGEVEGGSAVGKQQPHAAVAGHVMRPVRWSTAEIDSMLQRREEARRLRDFDVADQIKLELARGGVSLCYKTLRWKTADLRSGPLAPFRSSTRRQQHR